MTQRLRTLRRSWNQPGKRRIIRKMERPMTHAAHNRTPLTLVVTLSSVLFVADLFMPLGIADRRAVRGSGTGGCRFFNARLPFITATASTLLIVLGAALGPQSSAVPLWVGIPNRIFSLIVLWAAAILLQQRQQAEMQLRHARTSWRPAWTLARRNWPM